jgi:hypothetical protein
MSHLKKDMHFAHNYASLLLVQAISLQKQTRTNPKEAINGLLALVPKVGNAIILASKVTREVRRLIIAHELKHIHNERIHTHTHIQMHR